MKIIDNFRYREITNFRRIILKRNHFETVNEETLSNFGCKIRFILTKKFNLSAIFLNFSNNFSDNTHI